jgi:hypothetical protein
VPRRSRDLDLIFALQFERTVNRDNTVRLPESQSADRSGALASQSGGLHGDRARQVFTGIENSGALLRWADEDICPYVVRGDWGGISA